MTKVAVIPAVPGQPELTDEAWLGLVGKHPFKDAVRALLERSGSR